MVKLISLMQSMKNKVFYFIYLTIDQASLADIHANRGELYVQLIDIQQRENTAFLNLHRISLKFPKCFLVKVGHDSSRSSENRWPRRCSEFQNPPFASQVMISTLLVCLTNDCRYCSCIMLYLIIWFYSLCWKNPMCMCFCFLGVFFVPQMIFSAGP